MYRLTSDPACYQTYQLLPLYLKAAELDGIAVSRETNQALGVIKAFWRILHLAAVECGDVGVENFSSIQRHHDALALHFDFLEVPLSRWTQVAVLRADAVINRAVVLMRRQPVLACGGLFLVVAIAVDDL